MNCKILFHLSLLLFTFAANAATTVPASAYVQSGLVAQWDGIDNAGTGTHDANATEWVDRIGGFTTTKVNTAGSGGSWGENCFVEGASSSSCFWCEDDTLKSLIQSGTLTVEIFCAHTVQPASGKYEDWLGFGNAGGNRWLKLDIRTNDSSAPVFQGLQYRTTGWNSNAALAANSICSWGATPQYGAIVCDVVNSKYTATLYANGANQIHTVNYGTATPSDGVFTIGGFAKGGNPLYNSKIYSVRIYNRALTADEIARNVSVDTVRFNENADGYRWNSTTQRVECRVRFASNASALGSVTATAGGAAAASGDWLEYGASVTLTPGAADGYRFYQWFGDTDGLTPDANGAITFTLTAPRTLTAQFISSSASLTARTWTGTAGDGLWTTAANWSPEGEPLSGEAVTIPSGAKVAIVADTALLGSLDVSGTISNTTWNAALKAEILTVKSGGVLTCNNCFTDEANMTRVNIVCTDLTVEKGGKIHADQKGWKGGNSTHKCGYGPGALPSDAAKAAGSHGGLGSYVSSCTLAVQAALATNCYGSASAPVTAGSGGWGGNGSGGAGGGVVTIAAGGRVTVNGAITVDAQASASGANSGGGAGGSVFITCNTFAGEHGKVSAKGGKASESYSSVLQSGGGGRVAIVFDPVAQAVLGAPKDMYLGADAGGFLGPYLGSFMEATPGSLYFSSDALIDRAGATLFGQLEFADVTDKWTVDTICLTNGWVMMARDDIEVEVTGDMTVKSGTSIVSRRHSSSSYAGEGYGTRWDVGGASWYYVTNGLCAHRVSSVMPKLTVGGKLKLDHYGTLHAFATREAFDPAATTGMTTNLGAKVTVAGAIELTDVGKIFLHSHPMSGVSPVVGAASLNVDATSYVSANNHGFMGGKNNTATSTSGGQAPEYPLNRCGAGHGGKGGWCNYDTTAASAGKAYDSLSWPVLSGAGGCSHNYNTYGPQGGGVVRLDITGGIVLNGAIRANATERSNYCGGAAGGTVLIVCETLTGGGTVEVKGGPGGVENSKASNNYNGGGGGGGRIAVHYDPTAQADASCSVIFNAAGDPGLLYNSTVLTGPGDSGTVWFPDEAIVNEGLSHTGYLYVPELLNYLKRDSLVLENTINSFQPGGYVEIKNDLVIKGSSFGVSGLEIPEGYLKVGGDLIISGGHITLSGSSTKSLASIFEVGGRLCITNAQITITDSEAYPVADLFKVAGAVELDSTTIEIDYAAHARFSSATAGIFAIARDGRLSGLQRGS